MPVDANDIAAEWVARELESSLSAAERSELDAWLMRDIRNFGAYERAHAIAIHLHRARNISRDVARLVVTHPLHTDASGELNGRLSRRSLMVGSGAIAAVGALGAIGLSSAAAAVTYRTKRGEVRVVPLAGRSTVTMNTSSQIEVKFGYQWDTVRLVEGEALFTVFEDAARPFIAKASDLQVRALDTSFLLTCLGAAPPAVILRDGTADISRAGAPPLKVGANMRVSVSPDGQLQAAELGSEELQRALMWRYGKLSFDEAPLADVARTFARYSDVRIVIDDPAIARQTVTGVYSAADPIGFARAVGEAFDLSAEPVRGGVRLRSRI